MHYQYLKNFLTDRIRQNDRYIPAMILYLLKNDGIGSKEDIAKLLFIFDFRYSLKEYEVIVEKFASTLLEEYHLIEKTGNNYKLLTWPLKEDEINDIIKRCSKISNGFFTNLELQY
jgi:hypothetical protein